MEKVANSPDSPASSVRNWTRTPEAQVKIRVCYHDIGCASYNHLSYYGKKQDNNLHSFTIDSCAADHTVRGHEVSWVQKETTDCTMHDSCRIRRLACTINQTFLLALG